jgi:hypothetical protein
MDSNEEGDDEENNEAETDSKNGEEESDDNDLIRYMSDTSDELLKVQESSDINNNNTEEKPQIEGILNKYGWGDLPPCTKQSTWGNNLTNKSKRSWEDETNAIREKQRNERSNSPSNIHHRVTYCEWCDTPGITERLNGRMKCHRCRTEELRQQQEAEQHKEDEEDITLIEENKTEEDTTNEPPPQTPPRRLRQAATHIMGMIR